MRIRVQKWGNSLGVRIPRAFAIETKLEPGGLVDLALVEGVLVIRPLFESAYELEELLECVTEANIHREVDTGPALGQEAW